MSRSFLCCMAALFLFATVAFLYFTVGPTNAGAEASALSYNASQAACFNPAATKKINDPGPRVWETWKEEYEVYLKDGAPPPAWNDTQPIPGACETGA